MRRILIAIAFLLSLTSVGHGAAVLDTANIATGNVEGSATLSFNVTTSGTNRGLVCGVAWYDFNGESKTATYDSVSMTHVGDAVAEGRTVSVFSLINPSVGTNGFVFAPANFTYDFVGACMPMTGVNQSALTGTIDTDSNSGGNVLSTTVTVPSGGISLSFGMQDVWPTCTGVTPTGTNQDERYDICTATPLIAGFGSSNTTDTGSVTHSYTLAPANAYQAVLTVPIDEAVVSGSTTPKRQIINY